MKKWILILPLFFALAGCVPTALVLGATAGGAVVYDKRSLKTISHDRYATQNAQHLIDHSEKLKGHSHISIATFNHVMLMVGQTQTPELRAYAYQLIGSVKYVQRIYNEVTIRPRISFTQRTKDTWITTKEKTAMLAKKGLNSTQIKIVTENGTVYMMGLVSRHQANIAADVARRISGVKKVVKVFEYT